MSNIDPAKRLAAGHACLTMFTALLGVTHHVKQITQSHPPSGIGLGMGLNDKEREYLNAMAERLTQEGERLRRLGWRFRDEEG